MMAWIPSFGRGAMASAVFKYRSDTPDPEGMKELHFDWLPSRRMGVAHLPCGPIYIEDCTGPEWRPWTREE